MKKRRRITQCPNCQSQLGFKDNYCPSCGQENHFHENSMTELWEDFIGSLFNFDGKIWMTLKTLFLHPGKVSSNYVEGKKMSYVPPLRMYIFVSFFYFLVLHFAVNMIMNSESTTEILEKAKMDTSYESLEISQTEFLKFKELRPKELALIADSIVKNDMLSQFDYQRYLKLKNLNGFDSITLKTNLGNNNIMALENISNETEMGAYNVRFYLKPEYDSLMILEPNVSMLDLKKIYENPSISSKIVASQTNGYSWLEKLGSSSMLQFYAVFKFGNLNQKRSFISEKSKSVLNNFSYAMFLIMPIAALILYLFYFKRRKNYYPHFVLTVHLHTFIFLTLTILFSVLTLIYLGFETVKNGIIPVLLFLLIFYQLIYFFINLKNFYHLTWKAALLKGLFLNLIYFFLLSMVVSNIFVISIIFS